MSSIVHLSTNFKIPAGHARDVKHAVGILFWRKKVLEVISEKVRYKELKI